MSNDNAPRSTAKVAPGYSFTVCPDPLCDGSVAYDIRVRGYDGLCFTLYATGLDAANKLAETMAGAINEHSTSTAEWRGF